MGKMSRLGNALYEGDVSIDFVGRRMLWYTFSGIIVLIAVAGLSFKGLNMGIEFEGGVEYRSRWRPVRPTRRPWRRSATPWSAPASTRPRRRS